jgi:HEAT repeat protein
MLAQTKLRRACFAYMVVCLLLVGTSAVAQQASAGGQPVGLQKLVASANSQDEAGRLAAIHELGAHGAEAVPALTKLLSSDAPTVRAYAAKALAMIGPAAKGAAQGLVDLLADKDPAVRRQAIAAIGAIRPGPKVTVPLFAKLMQDSDPGVKLRVMQTVADAGGAAVPGLIEALHNDATAYWACVIIRDIGPDAIGTAPALVEKLKDKNPEIRREAILALASLNATDATAAIVPLLKDEPSRTAATYALAMLGSMPPEAETIVRANVKSDDATLSAVSMWALARIHPDDMKLKQAVFSHLIALLKSKDPFARLAAARGLAALPASPEIAGPIFEKALADADETTTHYMLDALAAMGAPAVPKLIGALKYAPLRGQVASILGRIGPPAAPATDALAKLLSDPDPNVSIEAGHALAAIGPDAKAAVPALIAVLNQTAGQAEGGPRHAAVFALGKIGPAAKPADAALLAILRKSNDSLSLLSAWSLLKIHGVTAKSANVVLPALTAGLASPLPQARQGAAETIGQLGPFAKSAAAQLEQVTKDADPRVRDAAVKALAAVRGAAS